MEHTTKTPDEQLRILLIDDNPDDRALVIRALDREFARPCVIQVGTAEALEAALAQRDFDVVITDYALRWSDGIAVLRQVKERYPEVPVIMFTNSGSQEVAVEAMKSGLEDYVIKSPQHVVRLSQAVRAALQRAQTRSQMRELQGRTRESLDALMAMARILVQAPPEGEADETGEPVEAEGARETAQVTARRVVELAQRVVGCRRAGIHSISPATGALQPLAVAGFTPEQEAHWFANYRVREMTLDDRLSPEVAAQLLAGTVVVLDAHEPPLSNLNTYDSATMLIAPMRVGEQLVGTLTLDYARELHVFSPDELELAGALAQLTALVIERERLLQERERQHAQVLALAEANRRMDSFLGIASHELRTPLTSIKANLQVLLKRATAVFSQSGDLSAEQRLERLRTLPELLERTQHTLGRLERLVNDLLDVSRISSGELPLHAEPADMASIVHEAVHEVRESNPGREIRLQLPSEPVPVIADAEMLVAAVGNYIGNALKYSRDDQPVEVTLRVESGARRHHGVSTGGSRERVMVAVRDFGPGLTAEQQHRIWERFYRAEIAHQSGSGVGLGLGLYITKSIVERHGGAVGVTSTPGDGSTFYFTIPLDAGSGASAPDAGA